MTAPPPRGPWWKRKRTWAAGMAWLSLPVLYVLSAAPASYARGRGWMTEDAVVVLYRPAVWTLEWTPLVDPWRDFNTWFWARGITDEEHRWIEIHVNVHGPDAQPLPGAAVSLIELPEPPEGNPESIGVQATPAPQGGYHLRTVRSRFRPEYRIEVTADGYEPHSQTVSGEETMSGDPSGLIWVDIGLTPKDASP